MKKTLLIALALLAVPFLTATPSQAQICIDFDFFCDGLELTIVAGTVTGTWESWDCVGATAPVSGTLNAGTAKVVCNAPNCPIDSTWSFRFGIVGPASFFDLQGSSNGGPWQTFQFHSPYTKLLGTCPFRPDSGWPNADQRRAEKSLLPSSLQ